MKKNLKVFYKTFLLCFIILSFTGCWDRIELDTIGIVMGIGIDKSNELDKVKMTVQVAKASEIKSSATNITGTSGTQAYVNMLSTGTTIFNAVQNFSKGSSRKLFFSQNQVIIVGKGIAEDGLEKYIDFFLRDRETRLLVSILISDKTADEILDTKSNFEPIPARGISELIKEQKYNSETPMIDLRKFSSRLMSETTSAIAPIIKIQKSANQKNAYVSGTAIFKKDKMVGEMNKAETRGLLWVLGEIKKGDIVVKDTGNDTKVSLEITRASSKIIPEMVDGKMKIKIKIKEDGNIGDQNDSNDLTIPKTLAILEKKEASLIKSEIMSSLKKAQSLDADVFGFGEAIYQKYPNKWNYMKADWDETFKNIDVELVVEPKIRRTGRITKPILSK